MEIIRDKIEKLKKQQVKSDAVGEYSEFYIDDLVELFQSQLRESLERVINRIDYITLEVLLLPDHPAEKIVRERINLVRAALKKLKDTELKRLEGDNE